MAVTLKDVARRAGVSSSAVSRTFTPGASVSSAMREKVERAADELGYRPNALASSLTTGRTKLIGLVLDNFRNPLFMEVFDLFTRGLQERGLRPLLVNLSGERDPEASVRMLRQYSVDAVIVASSTLPQSFAQAFAENGLPVVHSFGRSAPKPVVPVVGIDNVACGEMAAQTLLARGYRDVAYLGGPETATSTRDRHAGFVRGLGAVSLTPKHSFAAGYTFAAGRAEMQRLMGQGPLSEAYFCGDDNLAMGALSALRDARVAVPDRVGLLGLNDMEMAGWPDFALTTIRQPVGDIITASIDVAVARIEDPDLAPQAQLFECSLIERTTLRGL